MHPNYCGMNGAFAFHRGGVTSQAPKCDGPEAEISARVRVAPRPSMVSDRVSQDYGR